MFSGGCDATVSDSGRFFLQFRNPDNDRGVYRCAFAGSQQAYDAG